MSTVKAFSSQQTLPHSRNRAERDIEQSLSNICELSASLRHDAVPLNPIELSAVSAMVAYVAFIQEVGEEQVRAVLIKTFHVDTVQNLPSVCYNDAIRLLTYLCLDEVVN